MGLLIQSFNNNVLQTRHGEVKDSDTCNTFKNHDPSCRSIEEEHERDGIINHNKWKFYVPGFQPGPYEFKHIYTGDCKNRHGNRIQYEYAYFGYIIARRYKKKIGK